MKRRVRECSGARLLALSLLVPGPATAAAPDPVDRVDPMIGTDFFGHTYPGPGVPFGMVHLSPDTGTRGWTYSSGYTYQDESIIGFSHTHFSGTGMTAGGDVLVTATTGTRIRISPGSPERPEEGYRSRFDHRDEVAEPGYYRVLLKDEGVTAELTATRRAGMHRYSFPETDRATILFDLGHEIGDEHEGESRIRVVADDALEGYKQVEGLRVYFHARLDRPALYYGTFDAGYRTPESGERIYPYKDEERGQNVGAFLVYAPEAGEQVQVKVGLSYVGVEGARANLEAEIPGWDFDGVRAAARVSWQRALGRIRVTDPSDERQTIFYTALYHTLLAQYTGDDVDGRYLGMDGRVHVADGFDFFPSFSVWDTYRSAHPLLTLVAPEMVDDMVRSILAKADNFGWLPAQHFRNRHRQSMVGDHLVPVVVDAWVKGLRDFDADRLYEAMRRKATETPPPPLPPSAGRPALERYAELGWVPYDEHTESVANTLESAYDDWALGQLARALGRDDDHALFERRSRSYRNVFDSGSGFMRPRAADGTWLPALGDGEQEVRCRDDHCFYAFFDPLHVGRRPNRHYAESNAWQYLWSVQHDVAGLIDLLGGREAFVDRLDAFFETTSTITPPKYVGVVGTIGQYVHGNQPSHHVAYLYDYAGQPWKTQRRVRQVMERLYRTGPGGLCGNEDMGSLSSWYNLSAMGFYPVTPGHDTYAIGSPLFEEVAIAVPGGDFIVAARNASEENVYIQSATLNGEPFDRSWLRHGEIVAGGRLEFVMGPRPEPGWGVGPGAAPWSMSRPGGAGATGH